MKERTFFLNRSKLKTAIISTIIVYILTALVVPPQVLGARARKARGSLSSSSLRGMARIYMATADYTKAQPLAEQALSIARQKNADNEELGFCLIDLAYLYHCQGQLDSALDMCTLGLKLQEKTYYQKHPYLAYTLRTLCDIYRGLGQYDKASAALDRAVDIMLDSHLPDDKAMTQFYIDRGILLAAQGRYDQAKNFYTQAEELIRQVYKDDHLYYGNLMLKQAQLYFSKGQYSRADNLAGKAMEIQQRVYGKQHSLLAPTWLVLANIARAQGRYTQAETLLKSALESVEQKQGQAHPVAAEALSALGMVYMVDGKYTEAEHACTKAVEVLEASVGPDSDQTAMALNNLAILYIQQGKLRQAKPLCDRALATLQNIFEKNHPSIVRVRKTILQLQYKLSATTEVAILASGI